MYHGKKQLQTPKITLSVQDLQDDTIMEELKKCDLSGIYIFTELQDYSFISEFRGLRDLFIRYGKNVKDLSFIRDMPELFMFYIEDADLPDLRPLIDNYNTGERLPGKCMGFYKCKVEDTSALSDIRFIASELLIWPVEGDSKERWKTDGRAATFRFYAK